MISPKEAISALDELGSYRLNAQVSIMPVNWHRFSEGFDGKIPPFFEEFDRNTASGKMSSGSASNRNTSLEKGFTDMQKTFLSSASAEERLDFLKDFISEKIIHVMGLDDSVILSPVQPLLNIGLDSLVAVELKNIIGAAIGKTLPATLMFDYPTITELARFINGELDFVSTIGSPIDIDSGININSPTNIAHIEVDSDSTKILVEDARINRIQNLASN
ncbi:MAG: acyl carrier protein, partial [Pseudomonadales bacterium]|nr:acyl carrier protein [Pseudomonadales bacterium]